MARNDFQGSLDLLVLKTLSQRGRLHGYGIVLHIQRASDDLLRVEEGSLYPALHRMEQSNWISSEWALTETNRRAKYYKLTVAGRKELHEAEEGFEQLVKFAEQFSAERLLGPFVRFAVVAWAVDPFVVVHVISGLDPASELTIGPTSFDLRDDPRSGLWDEGNCSRGLFRLNVSHTDERFDVVGLVASARHENKKPRSDHCGVLFRYKR